MNFIFVQSRSSKNTNILNHAITCNNEMTCKNLDHEKQNWPLYRRWWQIKRLVTVSRMWTVRKKHLRS